MTTAMSTMTIGGMSVLTIFTCLSSSRSYTSAISVIVSGNFPVCSPTAIMSTNISGNIFCALIAPESVAPSTTEARTSRIRSRM